MYNRSFVESLIARRPVRSKLATKFLFLVLAVLGLAVLSISVVLYSSWRLEGLFHTTFNENLSSVRAAEELEIALLEQRGFVSSYILDGLDPRWLDELRTVEPELDRWLNEARTTAFSDEEHEILDRLNDAYSRYDTRRQDVIGLCRSGNVAEATRILLSEVLGHFREVFDESEAFLAANQRSVEDAVQRARQEVRRTTVVATVLAVTTVLSSGGLVWMFFGGVLLPLRRIAEQMRTASPSLDSASPAGTHQDELGAIREYVRMLMSDVAGARSTLKSSQNQLEQAEKLASVGRLAASVAHEIRNPLTAMKMWLFSLRKSVGPDPETDRRFDLISDELTRLEAVVQNFLEFSRPAETKTQAESIPELVAKTMELLGPRLAERQVAVSTRGLDGLPPVMVDAEQIKQVLINLLVNAADAMPGGGEVVVTADCQADLAGTPMVVLRVRDHGLGMREEVQRSVFQPFFTTKENGTGLGLCIAAQIMASHHGRLALESTSDLGSCFAMWIPRS